MLEELQFGFPLLSVMIFLPLIGAIILWMQNDPDLLKKSALGIAVFELALSVLLLLRFVPESAAMQFSERMNCLLYTSPSPRDRG
mgnify:CR=1 FL=1